MLDDRPLAHVDLPLLEEGGHGHDDGELLGIALEVVGHGEHGLILVPRQDNLRCLVEQLGVGLGDVEAAEGEHRRRRGQRG